MPSWFAPLMTTIGVVLVAVISVQGTRFAARLTARAAARTAEVQSRQVDVGEWQAIVTALRDQVKDLIARVDRLEDERRTERADTRQLLAFTRSLIAILYRIAPDHPLPTPPDPFVDELAYMTER